MTPFTLMYESRARRLDVVRLPSYIDLVVQVGHFGGRSGTSLLCNMCPCVQRIHVGKAWGATTVPWDTTKRDVCNPMSKWVTIFFLKSSFILFSIATCLSQSVLYGGKLKLRLSVSYQCHQDCAVMQGCSPKSLGKKSVHGVFFSTSICLYSVTDNSNLLYVVCVQLFVMTRRTRIPCFLCRSNLHNRYAVNVDMPKYDPLCHS